MEQWAGGVGEGADLGDGLGSCRDDTLCSKATDANSVSLCKAASAWQGANNTNSCQVMIRHVWPDKRQSPYPSTCAGVWHDRAGVKRGPGVPYSQIRILARARWQLFHLKGVLSRGGLKPHVVLAGDNAMLDDAGEEEDAELASDVVAGNSRDKVRGYMCDLILRAWSCMRHAKAYTVSVL